ncbi:MAG TPA: porin family protein [Xanthobacteraceae bacterium]|nr:porin family protein [Xanthobacteraceae bacterium]
MRLRLLALTAFFLFVAPAVGAADELARLNAQLINDPTNIQLNLRYARAAEESGKPDRALAAYERVLIYDPTNVEAKSGLDRVRAKILPTVTEIFSEFGAGWDSNPHQTPAGRSDADLFGRISIRDERTVADTRWRTTALFTGNLYENSGDLDYGFGSAAVGPVYSFGPSFTVHPAIGGTASYFDHHLFYSEAFTSLLFEGSQDGILQTYRIRGGFRDFDSFFPASQGWFADATAKFAKPDVFAPGDLVVLSPWVRWSGVPGSFLVNTPTIGVSNDVQIGRYTEAGARLQYYYTLVDWLVAGVGISYDGRTYARSLLSTGMFFRRQDNIYSPSASLIFRQLPNLPGSIRLDYRYERDNSNDPMSSYNDHIVTLTWARHW